jgi:hypothetical protein
MNELYVKLRKNLGLTMILVIGLGVEFSNFQSMFHKFMLSYRPDWGAFNHIPAMFLSAFLLLCIVIFGIRKQVGLSWFLALLTCVVSFAVYSRMNLAWNWDEMNEIHFVILILSGMLPMLVAYTTHQIAHDNEDEFDVIDEMMEEAKEAKLQKNPYYRQHSGQPKTYYDEFKKKEARLIKHERPVARPRPKPPVAPEVDEAELYQRLRGKFGIGEVQSNVPLRQGTDDQGPVYHKATPINPQHGPQNGHSYPPQHLQNSAANPQNGYPRQEASETKKDSGLRTYGFAPNHPQTVLNFRQATTAAQHLKPTPKVSAAPAKPVGPLVEVEEERNQQRAVTFAERREVLLTVDKPSQWPEPQKVVGGYLVKCANCGTESVKKTKTAKYCSEECRHEANKHHLGGLNTNATPGSGELHIVRDAYDSEGVMEWKL